MKAKHIFWTSFIVGSLLAALWLYFRQPAKTVIGPPDGCLFAPSWKDNFGGMHTGG